MSLLFPQVDDRSHSAPSQRVHQRGLLPVCMSLLLSFQELCEPVVKWLKLKISASRRMDSPAMEKFPDQGNLQTVHIRAFLPQIFFCVLSLRLKKLISELPRLDLPGRHSPYVTWAGFLSLSTPRMLGNKIRDTETPQSHLRLSNPSLPMKPPQAVSKGGKTLRGGFISKWASGCTSKQL